ncbi:MAG: LLM class flavin-dependent oxidoreductase [Myxococcota bacterium]
MAWKANFFKQGGPPKSALGSELPSRVVLTTDLSLIPFGANGPQLVAGARMAEAAGYGGVWTLDHFSGAMVDRPWSREPFTILGAMATATTNLRIGPLVANVVNRHPALLTSAVASLQSLSGGRAVLGLGSGAAPGSRFAAEYEAIGHDLGDLGSRRRRLVETIEVIKLLWKGGGDYHGKFFTLNGLEGVVGTEPLPPIVVGASSVGTVETAAAHGDGVNIAMRPGWQDLVRLARDIAGSRHFEVSGWT